MFKDVLLATVSHPTPTSSASIARAVAIAAEMEATISAIAFEISVPEAIGFLAEGIIDVPGMIEAVRERSALAAKRLLSTFEDAARGSGVLCSRILRQAMAADVPALLVAQSRVHDLTIMPVADVDGIEQWYAEAVIFGAGRPVLVLPDSETDPALGSVLVAWDGSRAAARAMADSMPFLSRASTVSVVTVTNEKKLDPAVSLTDLKRHLSRHGVAPDIHEVDSEGSPIGDVLRQAAVQNKCDLLVMGAYGHSRIREFILGGATKSLLSAPPVPLFLSH